MQRVLKILIAALILCVPAAAEIGGDRAEAIKGLLAKHGSWILYTEYTDASVPSERAQKLKFEYYVRDTRLMGRWVLEAGGCEFEISVRDDGFSFPWCPPYNGRPSLDFDAADAKYPFKSRNPRKLWLMAVQ